MEMTVNDVVSLAASGFSREEIAKIANAVASTTPPAPVASTTPPAPVASTTPPAPDMLSQILASMDGLKDTIHAAGIASTVQPTPPSAADVLASIINPPRKDDK